MQSSPHASLHAMPAAGAYARTARTGLTGRSLEAAVLAQCAADLRRLVEGGVSDPAVPLPILDRNRRLWSILADSVREGDTDLPPELRESIRKLALFVFDRTSELAMTWDAGRATALIDVNRALAAGLRGETA